MTATLPCPPAFDAITLAGPSADLPAFPPAPFALLLWDHGADVDAPCRARVARALLDAGCVYLVAGGAECEAWHDAFDEEIVDRELAAGAPAPLVPTTWHEGEPPEEVAFFFVHCATVDGEPPARRVVLHVGTSPAAGALEDALARLARDDVSPPPGTEMR